MKRPRIQSLQSSIPLIKGMEIRQGVIKKKTQRFAEHHETIFQSHAVLEEEIY